MTDIMKEVERLRGIELRPTHDSTPVSDDYMGESIYYKGEYVGFIEDRGQITEEFIETFNDFISEREAMQERIERLEGALQVGGHWSAEESDIQVRAFDAAKDKHGLRETLFAVVRASLEHRFALTQPTEGE